jgi:gliding motility-associated protein GldM
MAGGNLSPRQKMINMMYLVLTALLALNVSKEVLNSFFEVNLGIVKTTQSLDDKSNSTYSALDNFNNKDKAAPYIALTDKVKPKTNDLTYYIQNMKYDLVYYTDGGEVYLGFYEDGNDDKNEEYLIIDTKFEDLDNPLEKIAYLGAKDNRESSGHLFNPDNKGGEKGRATSLKDMINEYRVFLIDILDEAETKGLILPGSASSLVDEINHTLVIEEGSSYGEKGNKRTWEYHNFYDMPAVSALTLLSKWQSDIKNVEADVVKFIASNVSASDLKFTSAMATTIPSSTFVISGDEFSSKIFLTAYDETAKPQIYIGDYEILADSTFKSNEDPLDIVNGQGIYTVKTRGTGPKSYKGFIKIPQENEDKYYPFEGEYTVAKSTTVVSNDYLRAMFINQKNKLSVSVPGYNSRDLTVRFDKGSIKGSNGEYIAIPSKGTRSKSEGVVSVYGPNSKGKKVKLGQIKFKMYPVPIPEMYVDGAVNGSTVSKSKLYNGKGLRYKSTDMLEMFEGIKYSIKRFDMYVNSQSGGQEKATRVKTMRQSILSGAVGGDQVVIENIWYEVSGESRKYPSSLSFSIE